MVNYIPRDVVTFVLALIIRGKWSFAKKKEFEGTAPAPLTLAKDQRTSSGYSTV
jgi:hypothetical protein